MTWLPAAVAAANGILVGSAMVATRFVVHETGPASLALLRYAIGFCCLLPAVVLAGRVRFERRDLGPIALLGITQFGILIALLNYGLAYIPSARAALIFAVLPLLTMLLSAALGRERLTLLKSAGVLLTIVGVGLALGDKALERGDAVHSPVTAAVLGVLFLAEPVSAGALLALACVAAGSGSRIAPGSDRRLKDRRDRDSDFRPASSPSRRPRRSCSATRARPPTDGASDHPDRPAR